LLNIYIFLLIAGFIVVPTIVADHSAKSTANMSLQGKLISVNFQSAVGIFESLQDRRDYDGFAFLVLVKQGSKGGLGYK